jgi:hypothetical protein
MLRNLKTLIILTFAALVWTVSPAYSTITTYNSLAGWQAASSGVQTVDFEGLTPALTSTFYTSPTGVTVNNVEFIGIASSGSSSIQVIDTNLSSFYNFCTNDALMRDMDRPNAGSPLPYIHVAFLLPVTAFGVDLFSASPDALDFTITLLATSFNAPTNSRPNTAFFGATSDTPFSSVDFVLQGTTFNSSSHAFLDNFRFGDAQTVVDPPADSPEAATLLLIGTGLVGMVYLRKRARPEGLA